MATVFLFNPFKNAGLQTTVAVVMPGAPAVPRASKQKALCVLGPGLKLHPANMKCCRFNMYGFSALNNNKTRGVGDGYPRQSDFDNLSDKD